MKKMILTVMTVLMALSGAQAFARGVGPDSTWDEIYRAGLWPKFEKVQFGNSFIPVISTCVRGDQLVAESPFKQCVQWDNSGAASACVAWSGGEMTVPLQNMRSICVQPTGEGSCGKYQSFADNQQMDFDVEVTRNVGEGFDQTLFVKHFTIPACAN